MGELPLDGRQYRRDIEEFPRVACRDVAWIRAIPRWVAPGLAGREVAHTLQWQGVRLLAQACTKPARLKKVLGQACLAEGHRGASPIKKRPPP
jgi:hypothetical protein